MDAAPQLWWQHAGRAVLTERSLALGTELSRWGTTQRRQLRQVYQRLYLSKRSRLYWLWSVACGNPSLLRQQLEELEASLGDGEIAQFRWWAWASQQQRFGQVLVVSASGSVYLVGKVLSTDY